MNIKKATINSETFWATPAQIEAMEVLTSTNGGGIAVIRGYISESKRVKPETADHSFISRFSYSRLLNRKVKALEALTLEDIRGHIKSPKLLSLTDIELVTAMNDRRAYLIESAQKTLSGDRSDARREAHDRCYHRVTEGVRLHYKTVAIDNVKQPVTMEGFPIVESVLIEALEISRRITVPGEYKVVNSGVPVLIGEAMERTLPRTMKFMNFSLKENNFDSLSIGGEEMLPEDFKGIF